MTRARSLGRLAWSDIGHAADDWAGRALLLAWATVLFNVIEGLVSVGFGAADGSVALLGFGADSFFEVGSALLVVWRLHGAPTGRAAETRTRERLATRGIGSFLALLAAATAAGSVLQLTAGGHPHTAVPGLVIALASLLCMFALWRAKRRTARALDSRALASDAACTLACMKLSSVVLAGSVLFILWPELWWLDGAAAVVLAALIGREGFGMVRASLDPAFDAGCGCHG